MQTLRDSKLDAPLSTRTRLGFQHGSYASNCYALAVSSLCDEEEPLSFDEAQPTIDAENVIEETFDIPNVDIETKARFFRNCSLACPEN